MHSAYIGEPQPFPWKGREGLSKWPRWLRASMFRAKISLVLTIFCLISHDEIKIWCNIRHPPKYQSITTHHANLSNKNFLVPNCCFCTLLRSGETIIARFRDRSLIATFFPLRRKPVDTVDWQVAKKIGSLSFYTKMSRRWFISSLKLKGLCHWDFLIINTELKRKDGNFMYSRSLEDCNAEFFVS